MGRATPGWPFVVCQVLTCPSKSGPEYMLGLVLKLCLSQMALYIPHRCPQCFESVTLIQPQHKGGPFKGPAKGQCLSCMDEQEYDMSVPVNGKEALKSVTPKAETLT